MTSRRPGAVRPALFAVLVLAVTTAGLRPPLAGAGEPDSRVTGANYPLAAKFNRNFINQLVQEATVFPSFIGKTDQFWYSVRTPNGTKYWRVDPTRKVREPLFDVAKLAAQLSEAVQKPIDTDTLAITRVTITDDGGNTPLRHRRLQLGRSERLRNPSRRLLIGRELCADAVVLLYDRLDLIVQITFVIHSSRRCVDCCTCVCADPRRKSRVVSGEKIFEHRVISY